MKQSLGLEACHENTGSIGNGSCVGEAACFRNGCEEEDDGTFTCSLNEANVGDDSCIGYHACRRNTGTINIIENMDPGGSCSGESACEDNQGDIGKGSCLGDSSCAENFGHVGDGSWYVHLNETNLYIHACVLAALTSIFHSDTVKKMKLVPLMA